MVLPAVFGVLSFFKRKADDDFVDRMHYFLTTNILFGLSILVSFKQFGGKPIECMVPDHFTMAWEDYAENYCFAQHTYFLSHSQLEVPVNEEIRYDQKLNYYQWVPFFLLIEAVCFKLPSVLWQLFSGASGVKIHTMVESAKDSANMKPDVKKNTIKQLTVHLENALRFHRRLQRRNVVPHRYCRCLNLPYSATYVTGVYLMIKALYLANAFFQWVLLNKFMQTDRYSYYGVDVFLDLLRGKHWENTAFFPLVTLCDFESRHMGSIVNRWTIQCVLLINMFNEKIFIFLWFWYFILIILTAASFLYWFFLLTFHCFSVQFVSLHLELSEMPFDPKNSRPDVDKFVSNYLKRDGIFVLRMITMHTGIIFTTELVLALWKSFYGIECEVQRCISQDHGGLSDADVPKNFPKRSLGRLVSLIRRQKDPDIDLEQQFTVRKRSIDKGPYSNSDSNPEKPAQRIPRRARISRFNPTAPAISENHENSEIERDEPYLVREMRRYLDQHPAEERNRQASGPF